MINLDLLKDNRDQIWAEAVALYRLGPHEGGAWWFTDTATEKEACEEQDARTATDPWEPTVLEHVSKKLQTTGEEILVQCLKKATADLETARP